MTIGRSVYTQIAIACVANGRTVDFSFAAGFLSVSQCDCSTLVSTAALARVDAHYWNPSIIPLQLHSTNPTNSNEEEAINSNTPSACSNGAPASTPRKNVNKVRRPHNINTIIIKGHLKGVPEGLE